MKILHGMWIPKPGEDFIQEGEFYLWVEVTETKRSKRIKEQHLHPRHLTQEDLSAFVQDELGIKLPPYAAQPVSTQSILLPSLSGQPLPSPELARYLDGEPPEAAVSLQRWQVDCYRLSHPLKQLSEIHFMVFYNAAQTQPGSDFLFWYYYTQAFKQFIYKDHYIPTLIYREPPRPKGARGKRNANNFELYTAWRMVAEQYEAWLKQVVERMPLACVAGAEAGSQVLSFYDKASLLRHFSENLLNTIVMGTPLPAVFNKKIKETLLDACLNTYPAKQPWQVGTHLELYWQWYSWRQKLTSTQEEAAFHSCFQLQGAPADDVDNWRLEFLIAAKQDPSLRLRLADYWKMSQASQKALQNQFGKDLEKHLLLSLGYAARMYPKIWAGLETEKPVGVLLSLDEAFQFLKESAWILEDAGYKVIIPAWWTPKGRQRAKIRLRSSGGKAIVSGGVNKNYLSLDNLIQYRYELAMGDEPLSEEEWQQLVNAKVPLIRFRGQWMELDRDKMQQMLEFWQKNDEAPTAMSIQELLKKTAEEADTFEIDQDDALAEMLGRLRDSSRLEPVDNPPQLKVALREYQKRGVAWLYFLEQLGLNGCLADDMGLGKTMQVIARLVMEKANAEEASPTLLIAPTSVIGNWQKEVEKFAPHLKTLVHHGPERLQDTQAFKQQSRQQDMVITSYTLARKDEKLFGGVQWRRVVLDEAQNIKNPKTAQTKAILKLKANHRLALTGTPVENRLLDLWSIFNFLNPGYLGTQTRFRNAFELPVQRDHDPSKTTVLKHLLEPLILRRVKTDKNIIKDLPDKVEHKQYCNLSKEQASLYEAVIKDVEQHLEESEGIKRQGLMLSTLMKLKQICNHPMQFLQDGSAFTPERSHKLARLTEMFEEVMAEGDSALIFSQFTEIGENLEKYLKHSLHYNTYYLHGGTPRAKRETMIAEFQDPDTGPSVFILSVKAGGVGITLTKANHVFHFDRWWNPAVEDQATDRAFRIGQQKIVFVHKFVILGTLEERIDQMIEDKKQIAGAIVGSDESWLTQLDNQRFKELIALNKQTVME
jgi:Superfamily II DNA/RNA helicases, SNF2 family